VLDDGSGKNIDAFSFHYYSLTSGGNSPDDASALEALAKYRTYKNRKGEPMPLWHTEGGAYLYGSRSWLQTYRIPADSVVTPGQAAASMVRAAALFKAMGVKHYFDFLLGASVAGHMAHEDITSSFEDVTGVPIPGIASHAAMVKMIEDADGAGFEDNPVGAINVKVAHFKAKDHLVDVYWASGDIALSNATALKPGDKVRDMMGNPIDAATAHLSEYPIYLLRQTGHP
jgi:hypothetical protein